MSWLVRTFAAFLLSAFPGTFAWGITINVVAFEGDSAPQAGGGTNGTFNTTGNLFNTMPVMSNSGEVVFRSNLSNASSGGSNVRDGLFTGRQRFALRQVARDQQSASLDGAETFNATEFSSAVNDSGDVVFSAELFNAPSSTNTGIFRADATGGPFVNIVRGGDSAPNGDGTFSSNFSEWDLTLNSGGHVAFRASLTGTVAGGSVTGIFRGDGSSPNGLAEIVRTGTQAPNGALITDVSLPTLNEAGNVAFIADLTGPTSEGIFRGSGGALTTIAISGQLTGDGDGTTLDNFGPSEAVPINNQGNQGNGKIAFFAGLRNSSGALDGEGLFLGDGGAPIQIARRGNIIPDSGGETVGAIFRHVALNDSGQVAFTARVGGARDDLFRGDASGFDDLVRLGDAAPDGNGQFDGIFHSFTAFAMNDDGQIAIWAGLRDTTDTTDTSGIFLYDDELGLQKVIREGDVLEVPLEGGGVSSGNVTNLFFSGIGGDFLPQDRFGLNDDGEIAFRFTLNNGLEGIAIATVPEPSTGALALAGFHTLLFVVGRSIVFSKAGGLP